MSILSDIKAVNVDAIGVSDIKPSRYERDDLHSAKVKVVEKLHRSKKFAENNFKADDEESNDTCFYEVPQRNGYFVGVKYGNRWVKNVFGEKKNKFWPLSKEQLITVIELLAKGVEENEFDEQIKAAMIR